MFKNGSDSKFYGICFLLQRLKKLIISSKMYYKAKRNLRYENGDMHSLKENLMVLLAFEIFSSF